MVYELHPSPEQLEAYSVGMSSDTDLETTEQHLRLCEPCREEFALTDKYVRAMKSVAAPSEAIKRLRCVHITEDGPIFGTMNCGGEGKWIARYWGRQLDGGRILDSAKEANDYLTVFFRQRFPQHVCSEQCREELI